MKKFTILLFSMALLSSVCDMNAVQAHNGSTMQENINEANYNPSELKPITEKEADELAKDHGDKKLEKKLFQALDMPGADLLSEVGYDLTQLKNIPKGIKEADIAARRLEKLEHIVLAENKIKSSIPVYYKAESIIENFDAKAELSTGKMEQQFLGKIIPIERFTQSTLIADKKSKVRFKVVLPKGLQVFMFKDKKTANSHVISNQSYALEVEKVTQITANGTHEYLLEAKFIEDGEAKFKLNSAVKELNASLMPQGESDVSPLNVTYHKDQTFQVVSELKENVQNLKHHINEELLHKVFSPTNNIRERKFNELRVGDVLPVHSLMVDRVYDAQEYDRDKNLKIINTEESVELNGSTVKKSITIVDTRAEEWSKDKGQKIFLQWVAESFNRRPDVFDYTEESIGKSWQALAMYKEVESFIRGRVEEGEEDLILDEVGKKAELFKRVDNRIVLVGVDEFFEKALGLYLDPDAEYLDYLEEFAPQYVRFLDQLIGS